MARILVIDDEDRIRRLLRAALEMEGHEVLEARQGDEALRLHRTMPVELVITDIIMPEKDGLEVIMALRHDAPKLKIIAMSGGGRYALMEPLQRAEPLRGIGHHAQALRVGRDDRDGQAGARRVVLRLSTSCVARVHLDAPGPIERSRKALPGAARQK